jgi:hypothetical protein
MLSPMMTVVVLAVLWLIVVVPMVLKRKDDRAGERSVARFGGAMQALSIRRTLSNIARPVPNFDDELSEQRPARRGFSRPQVFVPGRSLSSRIARPSAVESLIHPDRVAKADLSEARRQMMARRRRSLTTLIAGSIIGLGWLIASGGMLATLVFAACAIGLAGYLYFLRSQAARDRARLETRSRRVTTTGYEASERFSGAADPQVTGSQRAVGIDDEDVALMSITETVDLTGLYTEEHFDNQPMRRAV